MNTSVTPNREVVNHFSVTTTVENAGRNLVRLEVSPCPRRFRVETMSGAAIALQSQICDAASRTRTLVPGERYDFSDHWDGKDVNGTTLSGEYRIVGQPYLSAGPSGNPVTVYIVR